MFARRQIFVFVVFVIGHLHPQFAVAHQRWHVEQLVSSAALRMLYSFFSCSPCATWSAGGFQSMLNTCSRGLRNCSGLRWQPRHHSISSEEAGKISGIWFTCPWQVGQPTPLFTWILGLKSTKSGSGCSLA